MRQRGLLLMVIGVTAALVAGLLVYYLSATAQGQPAPVVVIAPTVTPLPVQNVLLAARDIPARHVIMATDVVTREYPVGLVPADAFSSATDVLSQTATVPVLGGEVLVKRQFVEANGRNGASSVLPPGKVMVAF